MTEYNSIVTTIKQRKKRETYKEFFCFLLKLARGSLVVRDLTNIVLPQNLKETEYLTTLLVVVPKYVFLIGKLNCNAFIYSLLNLSLSADKWKNSYEKLTEFVLPRSSDLIFNDKESGLWTVTLFKKVVEDFKNVARENKWIVRKYEHTEGMDPEQMNKLKADKAMLKRNLILWCNVNFSETYVSWLHLKSIRCFVESVLRFGLPADFEAVLIWPNEKQEKKLRKALANLFSTLGEDEKETDNDEVPAGVIISNEKYYPYVSLDVSLDLKYESRD